MLNNKKGRRGYLPNKHVPIPVREKKKHVYEEKWAGIKRDPVRVDQAIKDNYNPDEYTTDVPWGYDPFAGDQVALQKKVLFRPKKEHLAMENKIKRKNVHMSSGISGEVRIKPPVRFLSKNSTVIPISTNPIGNTQVQHEKPKLEKRGNIVQMQSGIESQYKEKNAVYANKNNRKKQETPIRQTDANQELQFIPVFASNATSLHNKKKQSKSERETRVRFADVATKQDGMNVKSNKKKTRDVNIGASVIIYDVSSVNTARVESYQRRRRQQKIDAINANQNYQGNVVHNKQIKSSKRNIPQVPQQTDRLLTQVQGEAEKINNRNIKKQREKENGYITAPRFSASNSDNNYGMVSNKRNSRKQRDDELIVANSDLSINSENNFIEKKGVRRQNDVNSIVTDPNYIVDGRDPNKLQSSKFTIKKQSSPNTYINTRAMEGDSKIRVRQAVEKVNNRRNNVKPLVTEANFYAETKSKVKLNKPKRQQDVISQVATNTREIIESNNYDKSKVKTKRQQDAISQVATNTQEVIDSNNYDKSKVKTKRQQDVISQVATNTREITEINNRDKSKVKTKQVAKHGAILTGYVIEVRDDNPENTGIEANKRQRIPTITPTIQTGSNKPIKRLIRKKKR